MNTMSETKNRRIGESAGTVAISALRRLAVSTLLLFAAAAVRAQPETNALMQLMVSQPQIDITTPVTATAAFDPPVVKPGEPAIYRVTFNAIETSVHWASEIPAPRQIEVQPSAQAQIAPVVGGAYRPQASFLFEARANRPGIFSIPAFYVEVYGKPVIVPEANLEALVEVPSPHAGARRLILESGQTNVFVGEAIRVKVLFRSAASNLVESLAQVELSGDGMIEDKSSVRQTVEALERDGRRVPHFIYETSITPLAVGQLKLHAQGFTSGREFSGTLIIHGPVTIPGGPPQYMLLDSKPFALNVRPVPEEGRLPGFQGAIGGYRCDPPKLGTNQVRLGDPVQLTFIVRGAGDLARLSPPPAPSAKSWQIFPPEHGDMLDAGGTNRGVAFTYTLIPVSDDARATPPIPFSCFDPQRNAFIDLTVPGVPLQVLPDELATNLEMLAVSGVRDRETERKPALSSLAATPGRSVDNLVPWQMRAWFPSAQLAPALLFIAGWLWARRRHYLERHPEIVRSRHARRALRREVRSLHRAARAGDEAEFSRRAVNALQIACAPHFPAEPRALVCGDVLQILDRSMLNGQAAEVVRFFFSDANEARFAVAPDRQRNAFKLRAGLEQLLKELEEQL